MENKFPLLPLLGVSTWQYKFTFKEKYIVILKRREEKEEQKIVNMFFQCSNGIHNKNILPYISFFRIDDSDKSNAPQNFSCVYSRSTQASLTPFPNF
jgi:hypothetical protein